MSPRLCADTVAPAEAPTRAEIAEAVAWTVRVTMVLAKLAGQLHRRDDLIDCAVYALHGALRAYDPAKGKLKTYARHRIVGEVLEEIAAGRRRAAHEVALEEAVHDLPPDVEQHAEALAEAAGVEGFVMACAPGDLHPDAEAALLRREAHIELHRAVEALGPAAWRLFAARYRDGLGWREISKTLGIPERTLKDHDRKLRRRLRETLLAREEL